MFADAHTDDYFAIMRKKVSSIVRRVWESTNSILRVFAERLDGPSLVSTTTTTSKPNMSNLLSFNDTINMLCNTTSMINTQIFTLYSEEQSKANNNYFTPEKLEVETTDKNMISQLNEFTTPIINTDSNFDIQRVVRTEDDEKGANNDELFITDGNLTELLQHRTIYKEFQSNGAKIEVDIDLSVETHSNDAHKDNYIIQNKNNNTFKNKCGSDNCTMCVNTVYEEIQTNILPYMEENNFFSEFINFDETFDGLHNIESLQQKLEIKFTDGKNIDVNNKVGEKETICKDSEEALVIKCNKNANDQYGISNNSYKQTEHKQTDIISLSSDEELNCLNLTPLNDMEYVSLSSIEKLSAENFITNNKNDLENYTYNNVTDKSVTEDFLDTISIKSEVLNDETDSTCSGYHSSDFEFITEEEAKDTSHIINYCPSKKNVGESTCRTIEFGNPSKSNSSQNLGNRSVPSPTNNNNAYQNWANRWNYRRNPIEIDYSYRQHHEIPEGDAYLEMFQELFAPPMPHIMENKCITRSLMHVEYEGVGFDMHALSRQINRFCREDEFKTEAEENAKMIRRLYPEENRKRRRRF